MTTEEKPARIPIQRIEDCEPADVDRREKSPIISEDEFIFLLSKEPQVAIDLLAKRAKDCGESDTNTVRKWAREALCSDDLKLDLFFMALNERLAFSVEDGNLCFRLGERELPNPC